MGWMLRDKYDSLSRVKEIMVSTLIVVAQNDEVISMLQTKRLQNAFLNQPRFVMIRGANHSNIVLSPRYYDLLHAFIYNDL